MSAALIEAVRAASWLQRLVAVGFVLAGVMHFVNPSSYEKMTPDYLPAELALVLISGAAEIAGGVGVLFPRTRRLAGIGLIVLLVAVFPANLDMALYPDEHSVPAALLWARLPLQPLFIWWVYRATLATPWPRTGLLARAGRPSEHR